MQGFTIEYIIMIYISGALHYIQIRINVRFHCKSLNDSLYMNINNVIHHQENGIKPLQINDAKLSQINQAKSLLKQITHWVSDINK